MDLNPWPDTRAIADIEPEEGEGDTRNVVVAMGPVLDGFEDLVTNMDRAKTRIDETVLSDDLLRLAEEHSFAGPGNPYYEAHVEYFKRTISVLSRGGSAILESELGQALERTGRKYPAALFDRLDQEWSTYAQESEDGELGLLVPPVLAIVLTRAGNREDIPRSLVVLREEWAAARRRVWDLIGRLREASTIQEALKIRGELNDASRYFTQGSAAEQLRPVRVFWNVMRVAAGGALDAASAGGDALTGAATGAAREAISAVVSQGRHFARILFGRGAFDLARRVRRDLVNVEPIGRLLERHLTQEERKRLMASGPGEVSAP